MSDTDAKIEALREQVHDLRQALFDVQEQCSDLEGAPRCNLTPDEVAMFRAHVVGCNWQPGSESHMQKEWEEMRTRLATCEAALVAADAMHDQLTALDEGCKPWRDYRAARAKTREP